MIDHLLLLLLLLLPDILCNDIVPLLLHLLNSVKVHFQILFIGVSQGIRKLSVIQACLLIDC